MAFIFIILLLLPIIVIMSLRVYLRTKVKMCESNTNMTGKVIIVTGANTGIGLEIAKGLAARGGRVILACRNETKALQAKEDIISETGNENVVFKRIDLTSLTSVRKFCDDIYKTEERLDVLVNNAGVYNSGAGLTSDGIITDLQSNVFGPFLLTMLLLPLLKKSQPSRIVNVSSALHYIGYFNPKVINNMKYHVPALAYINGKFCNILFTVELERHMRGTGVVVNALHPGIVNTSIADGNIFAKLFLKTMNWLCYRTAKEAAQTAIYLSVSDECEKVSGKYFVDCEEWTMSWFAQNEKTGSTFWEFSNELVKYEGEYSRST